jgi:hypothetical protein
VKVIEDAAGFSEDRIEPVKMMASSITGMLLITFNHMHVTLSTIAIY